MYGQRLKLLAGIEPFFNSPVIHLQVFFRMSNLIINDTNIKRALSFPKMELS